MSNGPGQIARLPQLDLLRFVAAMAVTLNHYVSCIPKGNDATTGIVGALSHATRYGYLGVHLFFIISGFVILWSSLDRSATQFVVSRIARLFPTFWFSVAVATILITCLAPMLLQVDVPVLSAPTVLANATMMPALFKVPLIESVYWTLEIEIRFYALIFALIVLRQLRYIEAWLFVWLATSVACRFEELPWAVRYIAIDPYGPFFVAGCLFYLAYARGLTAVRVVGLLICLAACGAISFEQRGNFLTPDEISAWIVPLVVVGFFAAFAAITARRTRAAKPGLSFAKPLGDLTYSLYLIHGTLGLLTYNALRPIVGVGWSVIVITALSLVVAWSTTCMVDKPARQPVMNWLNRIAESIASFRPATRST